VKISYRLQLLSYIHVKMLLPTLFLSHCHVKCKYKVYQDVNRQIEFAEIPVIAAVTCTLTPLQMLIM